MSTAAMTHRPAMTTNRSNEPVRACLTAAAVMAMARKKYGSATCHTDELSTVLVIGIGLFERPQRRERR